MQSWRWSFVKVGISAAALLVVGVLVVPLTAAQQAVSEVSTILNSVSAALQR